MFSAWTTYLANLWESGDGSNWDSRIFATPCPSGNQNATNHRHVVHRGWHAFFLLPSKPDIAPTALHADGGSLVFVSNLFILVPSAIYLPSRSLVVVSRTIGFPLSIRLSSSSIDLESWQHKRFIPDGYNNCRAGHAWWTCLEASTRSQIELCYPSELGSYCHSCPNTVHVIFDDSYFTASVYQVVCSSQNRFWGLYVSMPMPCKLHWCCADMVILGWVRISKQIFAIASDGRSWWLSQKPRQVFWRPNTAVEYINGMCESRTFSKCFMYALHRSTVLTRTHKRRSGLISRPRFTIRLFSSSNSLSFCNVSESLYQVEKRTRACSSPFRLSLWLILYFIWSWPPLIYFYVARETSSGIRCWPPALVTISTLRCKPLEYSTLYPISPSWCSRYGRFGNCKYHWKGNWKS